MPNWLDSSRALAILSEAVTGETAIKLVRGSVSERDPGFVVITCPFCARRHRFRWNDRHEETGLLAAPPCEAPLGSEPRVSHALRVALSGRLIKVVSTFWEEPKDDPLHDDPNSAIPYFSWQ